MRQRDTTFIGLADGKPTGTVIQTSRVLPAADFAQRFAEMQAAMPEPGPDGVVTAWMSCNGPGCDATAPVDLADPKLPEGWRETERGDFCPACQ
jgi:hypothetical protein